MRSSFADKQEDVVRLRKAGKTYGEIREILKCHIPKSTLSYWCRNVALPETGLNRIEKLVQEGGEKGRALALSRRRVMRAEYLGSLYSQNKSLRNHLFQDKQTAKIALAVLYLAEGGKTQRGSLMFGNSDPNIISLFLTLLQKV